MCCEIHSLIDVLTRKTFARTDLPKEHRVVKEGNGGAAMTMDFKPERYV